MVPTDARGVTRRLTIAAVLAGLAYALSPGSCVMVLLLVAVVAWATSDLAGVERRWVLSVISWATGLRLVAIVLVALQSNPWRESFAALFPDARYALRRSTWLRNLAAGVPISPEDQFEAFKPNYGENAYNFVLAGVHLLFGPSPYAAHLLSALLFVCAALILFRLARRGYGPAAALLGLAAIMLMPSLFAWSISPLKEAPFALAGAVTVAAIVAAARAPHRAMRLIAPAIAVLGLLATRAIRPEGLWLTLAGLGMGLGVWLMTTRRAVALAGVLAAGVAISAVVAVPRVHDRVRDQVVPELQRAAYRHFLHTISPGHFYRVLDVQYYPPNEGTIASAGVAATARFLIRATVRFITVPEPWTLRPGFDLVAIPQQMIWYVLVTCAAAGAWYGMKRDRLLTSLCAGLCVAGWMLIGPASGNIGTLIRHRDSLMPWVVWLAAVGAVTVVPAMPARIRRWPSVDVAAAAVVAFVLPVGFGLFWLFRTPVPRVSGVEPRELAASARAVLHGQHLRPFLRVYVVETGGSFSLSDRNAWPPEAKYWLRTVNEAQIDLPALEPGVYDLGLADGAEILARLPRAFTIRPRVPPDSVTLIVRGRFIGLDPHAAEALRAERAPAVEPWMELASMDVPAPDQRSISMGGRYVTALVDGRVAVPATLRVHCALTGTECRAGGLSFAAGTEVPLLVGAAPFMFAIDHVEGAGATALTPGRSVDVVAHFIVPAVVRPLIRPGDRDTPSENHPNPVAAQVVRVLDAKMVDRRANLDVLIRVPAGPDGASTYRGHRMAPGAPLEFETDRYAVSGRVISVSPGGARP